MERDRPPYGTSRPLDDALEARDDDVLDGLDGFRIFGTVCAVLFFLAFLFFLFSGGTIAKGFAGVSEPRVEVLSAVGEDRVSSGNWEHLRSDLGDAKEIVDTAIDREASSTYYQSFYRNLRGLTVASAELLPPLDWGTESEETLARLRATWYRLYGPARLRELDDALEERRRRSSSAEDPQENPASAPEGSERAAQGDDETRAIEGAPFDRREGGEEADR